MRPLRAATFLLLAGSCLAQQVRYSDTGASFWTPWSANISVAPDRWQPGTQVSISAILELSEAHLSGLANPAPPYGVPGNIKADGFAMLVTAERTFDHSGWMRFGVDERVGTVLTPTGLPIEGGISGAITNRFGYAFKTPLDLLVKVPLSAAVRKDGRITVQFDTAGKLPEDLPPGIYRIRLDYGVTVGTRYYSLAGETFARRSFSAVDAHHYSPPIPASGRSVDGKDIDATRILPKVPWILLYKYNSNGYRGVVADEDQHRCAISSRNLMQDDVILPRYDDAKRPISYNLEPQVISDGVESRNAIPWEPTRGELSIFVEGPSGYALDLGKAPFVAKSGQWPTTRKSAFTSWRPPAYGQYKVRVNGWMEDIWGNRYRGGGTYRFWVAKRMTMATATFQGMSYPVGNRYGRDIGFAPAVPADVTVTAALYANSDPKQARTITYSGTASPAGIFGSAQGMKPLNFDVPGEYIGHVLATYTDSDGHLWVCSMRHAGVVYPEDSPIVARGKKLYLGNKYYDRADTNREGWVDTSLTPARNHLEHINYPYNQGDVLLIASDQQGANKIEPVLIWEPKENPPAYDSSFNTIGNTNCALKTSNGYSPHMFPEYINEWSYYYAGAPRPGFMSRFFVGENGIRAPYWPTSPNSFGGQINASSNGDLPGDIYRLIGGVVVRKAAQEPMYAGYLASAFILPKGSKNNRIIAPGSEELLGSDGSRSRIFLVGTRPGMMYEPGTQFAPALQIDPIVPVNITFTLYYPDGRSKVWQGTADKFGSFAGSDRATLDAPGVYRFTLDGNWEGHKARMPGLPAEGGDIYVMAKERPAGAKDLRFDLAEEVSFDVQQGITLTGNSTAESVRYAAVMPGAVLEQGDLPVKNGKFSLKIDPALLNLKAPTYDIQNLVNQRPEVKDVIHLTFFSKESAADGQPHYSFLRLIIRGNRVFYTKARQ
jgi:hypothetical protein